MSEAETLLRLARLNGQYAAAIDGDRLEDWPEFFVDRCLYKITSADNERQGLAAGIVYADSRAMLHDRVLALRKANIFERQRYRHIIGVSLITKEQEGELESETPFAVVRTMRDGRMDLFAAGVYRDRVAREGWQFVQRLVVCDSSRFDTLLAIPL